MTAAQNAAALPGDGTDSPAVDPATTYVEAARELDALVQRLESGQLDVDAVVAAVERASALVEFCRAKVRSAEAQVADITARAAA